MKILMNEKEYHILPDLCSVAIYVYKIQAICCNLIPKTIMTKFNRFEKN